MLLPGSRKGSDSGHLEWRVRLFALGAGLGLGGIFLEEPWMIWAAIVVLFLGFLLRFHHPSAPEDDSSSGDA